jgi:hypothetical protein
MNKVRANASQQTQHQAASAKTAVVNFSDSRQPRYSARQTENDGELFESIIKQSFRRGRLKQR